MENISIFQALGRQRLQELDGLRGLCALTVLISHLINVHILDSAARVSVMIFFVLSGFVIGYTTPHKFTYKEAKNYVIRRLIRLYPIYVFALLLTFALQEKPYSILDVLGHLFFLQGWLVPLVENNLPLWSLHYEFIFYLLFLVIWKFDIKIFKAMLICILSGILSAIFKFHTLEILGYFTLWLSGLWLAQNMTKVKLISKPFISYKFLSSCILMTAFECQNIVSMIINKYGTMSKVLPDILLFVLLTSVVAALIFEDEISWHNLTFIIIFIVEIITMIYGWQQHTFYSLDGSWTGYQSVAFCILILPLSFIFKIPIKLLNKMLVIGSFSYALYVIHFPILKMFGFMVKLYTANNGLFLWFTNTVVAIFSILLAWFLECYMHVKIAKQLKNQFKLI